MDIILIGSGNTATILGRKSLAAGHRIVQVYSRQEEHAGRLAKPLNSRYTSSVTAIEKKADLMIVALSDDAILPFIRAAGEINVPVAHTGGAVQLDAAKNPGDSYGVIWPLQSLRREIERLPTLTLLVDANKPESREVFMLFAHTVAETVLEADDQTRLKYHLVATLVNNFTNYLFAVAEKFCEKENISFSVLQPLMEETVMRMRNISPSETQTGPAIRNDRLTLDKHLQILKAYPDLLRIYEMFTTEIQKTALNPMP
jgi:Domain of unknown function (DUF2520)/NADP oxidoreductase coenzyme F420-dependent